MPFHFWLEVTSAEEEGVSGLVYSERDGNELRQKAQPGGATS